MSHRRHPRPAAGDLRDSAAWPLNGLRHPPERGTNGWYLWRGEALSQAEDFFQSLHTEHLADWSPDVLPYLALPPGWRFLLAPGHEDVWYDASLMDVWAGDHETGQVQVVRLLLE